MNYLFIIVILVVVLILVDKYIITTKNYGIQSSYIPPNTESIGFLKPEHRLLKILNNISGGSKIRFNGQCHKFVYNKNTISKELNDKLLFLLKDILNSINQISQNDYFIKRIENVYGLIDNKKNQRYFIDFFIYDTKNYYTIRLITDIVIIDEEVYINYLNVNSGSNSSLMNKYDIKFKSTGILFDSDMFHEDIMKIFDNHYSETFKVIGVSDSSLEYNSEDLTSVLTLNSLKQLYLPATVSPNEFRDFNKKGLGSYLEMYLPENQKQIKSSLFCNKYKLNWDNYGIPNKTDNSDPNCYLNDQINFEINEPWVGPGLFYERSSNDSYKWLKDPAIGNIIREQGYNV
jgi:hypothetical protein